MMLERLQQRIFGRRVPRIDMLDLDLAEVIHRGFVFACRDSRSAFRIPWIKLLKRGEEVLRYRVPCLFAIYELRSHALVESCVTCVRIQKSLQLGSKSSHFVIFGAFADFH